MPTNTLSDAKCRAAKPGPKPVKMFDGGGLHLFVSPTGAKVWRMAYRFDKKPQTATFGPYPAVSLAEARARRDAVHAQLRAGVNPKGGEQAAPAKVIKTLAAANDEFWSGRADLSESYRENARRAIEMHLCKALGQRDISTIDREALMMEFRRMDADGLLVYLRKVRMWVSQVFDWAIEHDYATINPAALIDPRKAFSKAPVKHFASLDLPLVPALVQRLSLEGNLQSALACWMLGYTLARTNELRQMRWDEIEGDLWRLPAGRMKRRRDHLVPLPRQAVAILKKQRERSRGSEFVFTADHTGARPMSENGVLYLLHRMGFKGTMTGHGWRTIGSTWANERGYPADVIEKQLAHEPADKVRAAYNRAEYLPQRREMLQAFADWLDSHKIDARGA